MMPIKLYLQVFKSPARFLANLFNRSFITLFLAFFALIFVPTVFADPSFPIEIRSEYLNSRTQEWGNEVTWVFRQKGGDRISVSRAGSEEPVIVLTYDSSGRLGYIEKRIPRGSRFVAIQEHPQGPIVLSEGFPVPFDDLSPFDDGLKEATIEKKAGTLTFSYRVTREVTRISHGDALSSGMVDPTMAKAMGGKGDLRLVTIRKAGGLVVKQLWAEGDAFWVYEETPVRRSRRVSISVAP